MFKLMSLTVLLSMLGTSISSVSDGGDKEQNMRTRLRNLIGLAAVASFAGVVPIVTSPVASAVSDSGDTVFFSEIHYDNEGGDVGEAVEIFGPTCTDLSGWTIEFYNGSSSVLDVYATADLAGFIPDLGNGFGTVSVPQAGIQNGAPDGLALIDDAGVVRQFFSYEGTFVPIAGTAAGLSPTELPVSESSSTPVAWSLQLQGAGDTYGDFAWTAGPDNFGGLGLMTGDGAGGDPTSCSVPDIRFNELHYDNAGGDVNEAIEVLAPAGTDLTGWSIVLYNGSTGLTYNTTPLSGVVADQGGGNGVVSVAIAGIQNGSPDGMALIDDLGGVVEFLSYEGDFTAADGPAFGMQSHDIGASGGSSTLADQSLQRDDAGAWSGPWCSSFGELNETTPDQFCPTPATPVKIWEVQGSGSTSPLLDQRVIIEGVVVGDQEGPSPALRGFFVQEEDSDADGDLATSDGVFVFNFDFDDVNVGDAVRVEGTVQEFNGNTQLGSFAVVENLGAAPTMPTPASVIFPLPVANDLEAYEGMSVTFDQTLVISEYFNYDRFGEVIVALPAPGEERPMVPTAVFDPDSQEALDRQDLNARSRITIDDGNSSQNPSTPVHPINRQLFSNANSFRGGDQVTGLTGPIYFAFGLYRILPVVDGYDSYVQTTAPPAPEDVGGGITVATLNALNYFLTTDDGINDICGPNQNTECRGADDAEEFDRQRVKLLNALEGLDADVIGVVEIENTPGVEALADLADGLNDRLGAGTYDYVAAGVDGVVGPDTIKVGILYRPGAVAPIGDVAILDSDAFLNPNGYPDGAKNRAAVASSFVDKANGAVFSVVVNHLKSKGSSCAPGDDHPLAGSCNDTRTKAAQVLADWLGTNPTAVDDSDWMIIGDLNSYDKEDPISLLTDAGYTDLIAQHVGEYAYSYVFGAEFGYLDYVMSSASLTPQVSGATEWHINSDEPDVFDYDMSFKPDYQDNLFDATTPFRASDHDAALVGLELSGPDAAAVLGAAVDEVAALYADGVLNKGQANSLTRSLLQALAQIEAGHTTGASGILTGVLAQLDDFVADGILTAGQASIIKCYAGAVLAGL